VSKWRLFSFIFIRGNREKYGGWGTTVMLLFAKDSLVKKGSVRRCVAMMQQPVLLSRKFGTKYSHILTQTP
jgi:hypothetical protein